MIPPICLTRKKRCLEFNLKELKDIGNPIACTNATHNCRIAQINPTEANGLHSKIYWCDGVDVILTSNILTDVGFHNGDKG